MPSPFAAPGEKGYLRAIVETWKLVCLAPQRFFARVRTDQLGPAILFGLLASFVGGLVAALFSVLYNALRASQFTESLARMPPQMRELMEKLFRVIPFASPNADPWTAVPFQLVFALVNYFVGMLLIALVVHLFLLMFKGAGRGFGATLTVVAYSYAAHAVQAVGGPFLGSYVAMIWQLVVLVIGLAAVHRADVWKSLLAVLLPLVLCCCCIICGAVMFGASLAGAMQGSGAGTTNL
jgi:hypothetical protein